MAAKKKTRDELVPVELFQDGERYKDDVFVAVNGKSVQIKRGQKVMVKRKFAEVLARSQSQDRKTAQLINQKSSEYEQEAKARNML